MKIRRQCAGLLEARRLGETENREKVCVAGEEGVVGKTRERKADKSAELVTLNLRRIEISLEDLLNPWGEMCACTLMFPTC